MNAQAHDHPYQQLEKWRNQNIDKFNSSNEQLNHFHDVVMQKVVAIALENIKSEWGIPPSEFSWFLMGSGGRYEQAILSDQDHGLVYEDNDHEAKTYFGVLGKEIASGLYYLGYPYCDGNVMSSNSVWCKSLGEWKNQIWQWMEKESWESIRYLLIFYDARVVVGKEEFVSDLKCLLYNYIDDNFHFFNRLLQNTLRIKKGLGFFNHFLVEESGPYTGTIHIKEFGFFPYVNAIRLLAIKEKIVETSTLTRCEQLCQYPQYKEEIKRHQDNYQQLLAYRLMYSEQHKKYEDVHYLDVKRLTLEQKKEVKKILKEAIKLHHYVQRIIEKGC